MEKAGLLLTHRFRAKIKSLACEAHVISIQLSETNDSKLSITGQGKTCFKVSTVDSSEEWKTNYKKLDSNIKLSEQEI